MPPGITETHICNAALVKIGAERIASLSENNKRAIACNTHYALIRDQVLEAHPWKFATARQELAVSTEEPVFGWDYKYPLPQDCLRVTEIDDEDAEWDIEGRDLVTDNSTVMIKYIKQITDTSWFSPTFVEAVSCRLAAELAYHVAQSNTLQDAMMKAYGSMLREARTMNGQQGSEKQLQANTWINSRA
jgi:hypothetical protein